MAGGAPRRKAGGPGCDLFGENRPGGRAERLFPGKGPTFTIGGQGGPPRHRKVFRQSIRRRSGWFFVIRRCVVPGLFAWRDLGHRTHGVRGGPTRWLAGAGGKLPKKARVGGAPAGGENLLRFPIRPVGVRRRQTPTCAKGRAGISILQGQTGRSDHLGAGTRRKP